MSPVRIHTRLIALLLAVLGAAVLPPNAGPVPLARAVRAAAPLPAGLALTEVKPEPDGRGWIEIYNNSPSVIDLAGLTICANNLCSAMSLPSTFGSNLIPQDFVLIAADAGKFRTAHPTFFGTIGSANNPAVLNGLKPEGDTLTLHAAGDGRLLDAIAWGPPGPTPGTNQTVQRDIRTGDTFIAAESLASLRPPSGAVLPGGAAPPPPPPGIAAPGATAAAAPATVHPPGAAPGGAPGATPGAASTPVGAASATPAPTGSTISAAPAVATPANTTALSGTALVAAGAPAATGRPTRPASLTPRGIVAVGIEEPAAGATVTGTIRLSGWAVAASGAGVDRVWAALDGDARGGGTYLGAATVGLPRPDLVEQTGDPRYAQAGFDLAVDLRDFAPGWHWLVLFAHEAAQPDNAGWDVEAAEVLIGG